MVVVVPGSITIRRDERSCGEERDVRKRDESPSDGDVTYPVCRLMSTKYYLSLESPLRVGRESK